MKVFYKYIMVSIFSLAFFLVSGYSIAQEQNTDFQKQVPVSAERWNERSIAFAGLREVVRLTNNEDSKEILAILESKSMMITPTEKGYLDPIFSEQKEKIKIAVILPRDA